MAEQYKIEKNVPLPMTSNHKYPLAELCVGDSILVPRDKGLSARVAACQYGQRSKKKFATRTVEDGVRIWRVE